MKKQDVYDLINEKIIEKLESGVSPWRKPWNGSYLPCNHLSKKPYRGINYFMLSLSPYPSNEWLTFKQAKELKGNVKKGEKSTPIFFWNTFNKEVENSKGEMKKETIPFLKVYHVFNLEQCENIEAAKGDESQKIVFEPVKECEKIIEGFPLGFAPIKEGESRAYYHPTFDYINLPKKENFISKEFYYSVLFHESIHATGHEKRLNRETLTQASYFGSSNYSHEELIAEMGASYLCGMTGISDATIDNSASYLSGWLAAIRKDNKLVLKAATQAQKAVDYLLQKTYETQGE